MDTGQKVFENRIRRLAKRQRLVLRKTRRRDPHAWDYATYELVSDTTQILHTSRLSDIEAYLTGPRTSV